MYFNYNRSSATKSHVTSDIFAYVTKANLRKLTTQTTLQQTPDRAAVKSSKPGQFQRSKGQNSAAFLQVLALVFIRKLLDLCFTKKELTWLDDLIPESKKKKADDKEKKMEVIMKSGRNAATQRFSFDLTDSRASLLQKLMQRNNTSSLKSGGW